MDQPINPLDATAHGWTLPEVIEALISAHEDPGENGFVGGRLIQPKFAAKLQRHPGFERYGHVEERKDDHGNIRHFLFRKKDWDSTYYQQQLKKHNSRIATERDLMRSTRFNACLHKLFKWYPRFKNDKRVAVAMLQIWLEDWRENPQFKDNLLKFGYFEGIEDDEARIEELKEQLAQFEEENKDKWY